jgi:hypothetical protein
MGGFLTVVATKTDSSIMASEGGHQKILLYYLQYTCIQQCGLFAIVHTGAFFYLKILFHVNFVPGTKFIGKTLQLRPALQGC